MGGNPLLDIIFGGIRGNRVRRARHPREVEYGDVVCVESGRIGLKRYGIWTGGNFILYGENRRGRKIVHEESFRDFLGGTEHFAICEFPRTYGRPIEWEQTSPFSSVVMPQHKIWRMLERERRAEAYRLYPPHETVCRAKSKLGADGYPTSEHFALWCKTGIAESHELEAIRDFGEQLVVY